IFIVFGLVLISIIYLIIRLSGSKGLETSMKESDYKYSVASWLEEMARVVSSFKYSRNNTFHIDNTDKLVTGYLESRTSHFKILLFQYWSLIGFKVLITAGMLIVGSILLVDQQLNIGQFIAAEIVILLVINSVEKLIINLDKVYDVLTSVEKLSKVTEKPIEVNGNMDIVLQGKGLSVQMNNVSFDYQNDYKGYVLQQLNFNIQPGEKVCIMGPPGSGKSTLLRLLTGSYTSFEGSILINSTPLSNYKLSSLRAHTGILLSQQDIFHGTLLENVTMGDPTISVEQILNLAQQLKLDDFLITMKDGFNTMLEPLGKKLSRKMVHKILLLRALVNNPSLLLLEEPLENLDRNCIDNVLTYLLNCQNTVIAVSTNEQFASACSKVIYIENGSIKAIGNWSSIKNTI
ncbi:MAG: ATP-binding cassette domain-containing protein, partial [Ferruginibacter sp.]